MKIFTKTISLFFILLLSTSLFAQDKIAIDDEAGILSEEVNLLLQEKFKTQGLEYNNMVNYSKRCEYHYANIFKEDGQLWLLVADCDDRVIGEKKLSSAILTMVDNDKAGMIVYTVYDILENPAGKAVAAKEKKSKKKKGQEETASRDAEMEYVPSGVNQHSSRYFFSPSSFNLRKGELYYNTISFATHDIQYGITDNFSVGMGTTVALNPFYITPKYSFKFSELHRAAIGDMVMLGTWSPGLLFNLLYGTYTYGTEFNNITVGGGWFYGTIEDVLNEPISQPIINLSGMAKMSDYMYFVSENYFLSNQSVFTARDYSGPTTIEENFELQDIYFAGFFGMRFINKKTDVKSVQAGLAYYNRILEDIPAPYNGSQWDIYITDLRRLFIPQITFTYKFGKRY